MVKKGKKKILSSEEKKLIRDQKMFGNKIKSIFKNLGFEYLSTLGIERFFGDKKGELDYVFLYKNIIVVFEDTLSKTSEVKDHLKNKSILFREIERDRNNFIEWLKSSYSDKFEVFEDYDNPNRYHIYYLYGSKNPTLLTDTDKRLYTPVKVLEDEDISYFQKITANIKYSARTEFFRYLDISNENIGDPTSESTPSVIKTTIIAPQENTKLKSNARIVSFMMSAEKLMKNSYVLRKDNWEESIGLYQRLIEKRRIDNIREFLAKKKETFLNNIIVTLPDTISFVDGEDKKIELDKIINFSQYKLVIPDEINSICVIDGQHRIFAHYEGNDKFEPEISKLRTKLHLLVTGLIFPKGTSDLERRMTESEIFLSINSNSKPVPPDVLLHIESLKDPFSDLGVARQVLQKLNKGHIFTSLFQLSLIKLAPIKIPSIIKFALRYLVEIREDKETLFKYWLNADKGKLLTGTSSEKQALLVEYIDFCTKNIESYFSAIRECFSTEWKDLEGFKILSTTSINGFIIALRGSLKYTGLKDRDFYKSKFSMLKIDFSKKNFPYTSSQYAKFSRKILETCFGIGEPDGEEGAAR